MSTTLNPTPPTEDLTTLNSVKATAPPSERRVIDGVTGGDDVARLRNAFLPGSR
jgi:hypothetical protein